MPTSPHNVEEPAVLVRSLIATLSPDFIHRLLNLLRTTSTFELLTKSRIRREMLNEDASGRIAGFLSALRDADPTITPPAAALGVECASEVLKYEARSRNIELVWTGPESGAVSVRRSAAVLLEMIDGATAHCLA